VKVEKLKAEKVKMEEVLLNESDAVMDIAPSGSIGLLEVEQLDNPIFPTVTDTKKSDSPDPSETSDDKEKEKGKDEKTKVDIKDVDMSKLEWEQSNTVQISKKYLEVGRYRSSRKYPCVIKQLLDKSDYAVRVRAKNSSGWGDWSAPQIFMTKKLLIDSKILKAKEKKN